MNWMFKKLFLIVLTLAQMASAMARESRPTVAVVLAGGGAKGVAHIEALKTIEQAGIPIDMVVGTSMGSIIGGLYCVGYSPDSLRTICSSNDWIQLIADNPDYFDNSLTAKKENENYLLRMAIDPERTLSGTGFGGVIEGHNVMRLFRNLTRDIPDSISFYDLPIPFACVATNAITGEMKVFHEGNLPRCMRASMAIPTVFTPVKIGNEFFVDGGVVDNFPVDVAREMGADIVIGVDLVRKDLGDALANSAVEVLLHVIDLVSMDRYNQNIASCDIYMPIDVTGYHAASFTAQAIDTLFNRGTYGSQLKAAELDSLYHRLNMPIPPIRTRIGEYSYARVNRQDTVADHPHNAYTHAIRTLRQTYKKGAVNIGGRFDNQEHASILFGLRVDLSQQKNSLLNIRGRLGQRMGVTADLSTRSISTQRTGFRYRFMHSDLSYYYNGEKAAQVTSNMHDLQLYFTQVWHETQYRFGVQYQMNHYRDALYNSHINLKPDLGWENFWSYFIEGEFNSLDQQYFPNSGYQVLMSADVISDNLYEYDGHSLFPILMLSYQSVVSPTDDFSLLAHLKARAICSGDATRPWALANIAGGMHDGMQVRHQLTMAGFPNMVIVPQDGIGIFGISARKRLFQNHYITFTTDLAIMANKLRKFFASESTMWGAQAGYAIKTPVGPVAVDLHWNDQVSGVSLSINAGYYF